VPLGHSIADVEQIRVGSHLLEQHPARGVNQLAGDGLVDRMHSTTLELGVAWWA